MKFEGSEDLNVQLIACAHWRKVLGDFLVIAGIYSVHGLKHYVNTCTSLFAASLLATA